MEQNYKLLAHIYQGRNLPAADKTGMSDAYATVRLAGQSAKTKIVKETLNPLFYETLELDVSLPDRINMSYAPDVQVTLL